MRHDRSKPEAAKQACLALLKERCLTQDEQATVYRYLAKISRDQGHEAMIKHYIAARLKSCKRRFFCRIYVVVISSRINIINIMIILSSS